MPERVILASQFDPHQRESAMLNFACLRLRFLFAGAVLAFGVSVTSPATLAVAQSAPAAQRNQTIDDFFRDFTAEWVRNDPDLARRARYFSGAEQDRLERQLTPRTLAHRQARIQLARRGLAELQRFDRTSLSQTQRVSADLMRWQLESVIGGELFLDRSFPLEQLGGANVGLVNVLVVQHPVITERDAENYVAALGQVATRLGEAAEESRQLATNGVLPPRFILRATVEQMQRFIASPPAQNPFVTTLAQKMPSMVPAANRQDLLSEAQRIVETQVYPAWREAIALLESQVPRATDDAGLWRFPNGAAAYAYHLRRYTTTAMTPDQVHQLGLRQVESIQNQMDQILRRLGRVEGSVKERMEKLRADLRYPNPASEESCTQIMRDIEAIMRDAEERAKTLFATTPKSPVIAQAYPRFREANAPASYSSPPADGSRPGIFQYPLRLDQMTKFGLKTTVYHEAVPGHHFQVALQLENKELPRFRQQTVFGGISALSEGWALYAEDLAAESGWYENDPEGLLGQLFWEEFRARRLVVDTGLHAKRWTRQQAIDYGIDVSEVERYVVNPGQAASYMIGQLKILELRERAGRALGDRFSVKDFHSMVLASGALPLELLERQTDDFIARAAGR
jgi:uncharacterized protein (DUF885 family)